MQDLAIPELEPIRRASRRAAGITAMGAVVLFGAFAYGIWHVQDAHKKVLAKQEQIQKLEVEEQGLRKRLAQHTEEDGALLAAISEHMKKREELENERRQLEAEIASLRASRQTLQHEKEVYQSTLASIHKEVENTALSAKVEDLTPVSAAVTPRAAAQPVPGASRTYDFSLWVEVPDAKTQRITSVTYEFNHPTFPQKQQISSDAARRFQVGYRGWGCLRSVIITLKTAEGAAEKIDFDMCKALGW